MNYTHVLWDFNGTILDDVDAGIKSVNKLLADRGLPELQSREDYHKVFGFPIIDYYRRLGFDFDKEPYEVIAPIWVEEYLRNVKSAEIFFDVKKTVEKLRSMGVKQFVLSATELDMLESQLSDLGLKDMFDGIFGLDNIHAESKVSLAHSFKEENRDAKILVIGDTVHDAETAKAIDADCILIARGHQPKSVLGKCGVRVADELSEIFSL